MNHSYKTVGTRTNEYQGSTPEKTGHSASAGMTGEGSQEKIVVKAKGNFHPPSERKGGSKHSSRSPSRHSRNGTPLGNGSSKGSKVDAEESRRSSHKHGYNNKGKPITLPKGVLTSSPVSANALERSSAAGSGTTSLLGPSFDAGGTGGHGSRSGSEASSHSRREGSQHVGEGSVSMDDGIFPGRDSVDHFFPHLDLTGSTHQTSTSARSPSAAPSTASSSRNSNTRISKQAAQLSKVAASVLSTSAASFKDKDGPPARTSAAHPGLQSLLNPTTTTAEGSLPNPPALSVDKLHAEEASGLVGPADSSSDSTIASVEGPTVETAARSGEGDLEIEALLKDVIATTTQSDAGEPKDTTSTGPASHQGSDEGLPSNVEPDVPVPPMTPIFDDSVEMEEHATLDLPQTFTGAGPATSRSTEAVGSQNDISVEEEMEEEADVQTSLLSRQASQTTTSSSHARGFHAPQNGDRASESNSTAETPLSSVSATKAHPTSLWHPNQVQKSAAGKLTPRTHELIVDQVQRAMTIQSRDGLEGELPQPSDDEAERDESGMESDEVAPAARQKSASVAGRDQPSQQAKKARASAIPAPSTSQAVRRSTRARDENKLKGGRLYRLSRAEARPKVRNFPLISHEFPGSISAEYGNVIDLLDATERAVRGLLDSRPELGHSEPYDPDGPIIETRCASYQGHGNRLDPINCPVAVIAKGEKRTDGKKSDLVWHITKQVLNHCEECLGYELHKPPIRIIAQEGAYVRARKKLLNKVYFREFIASAFSQRPADESSEGEAEKSDSDKSVASEGTFSLPDIQNVGSIKAKSSGRPDIPKSKLATEKASGSDAQKKFRTGQNGSSLSPVRHVQSKTNVTDSESSPASIRVAPFGALRDSSVASSAVTSEPVPKKRSHKKKRALVSSEEGPGRQSGQGAPNKRQRPSTSLFRELSPPSAAQVKPQSSKNRRQSEPAPIERSQHVRGRPRLSVEVPRRPPSAASTFPSVPADSSGISCNLSASVPSTSFSLSGDQSYSTNRSTASTALSQAPQQRLVDRPLSELLGDDPTVLGPFEMLGVNRLGDVLKLRSSIRNNLLGELLNAKVTLEVGPMLGERAKVLQKDVMAKCYASLRNAVADVEEALSALERTA